MVDLTDVLGNPYETVTESVYSIDGELIQTKETQQISITFITNFILLMFLTIFLSNVLLRMFFRK